MFSQIKISPKLIALASFLSITLPVSISASQAQAAETFTADGNMALNTNNAFRRIDNQPRMSIFQRNDKDPDQQFDRLPGNRGGILLKHGSTGKCLNAHYLSNGSEINVWPCDSNDPDQNFVLSVDGGGYTQIKRAGTNQCVDAPTRDNQGKVQLWECVGNSNQRWRSSVEVLPPLSNGAEAFFSWAKGQRYIARLDTVSYKGECVSLIARYLAEVFFPANQRNKTVFLDNGGGVASKVATNYSQYFGLLTNQGLPKRGAVISFPSITLPYGHVAIVMDAQQLPNGQRQVKIMDSGLTKNEGYVKEQTYWINIPDGRANGYGTGIVWTNPK